MKDLNVLVTGGAGYIGGLTTDCLLESGANVKVYDNILYEDRYLKDVNFVNGDVRDVDKLLKEAEGYDVVVLMGALVGDEACEVNQKLTKEINFDSIKEICERLPLDKHIIFMSTCSVYGAQNDLLTEESDTNPLSWYAATKLKSEKYVIERGGTIFRLGTVFGLGDSYSRVRLDLVVNILTMRALKHKEITIYGGEQWRPIIAVKDIAEYVKEACYEQYGGNYIISSENVMIRDLGERVVNVIEGTKINYTDISFQDARNYRVDNSKSMKTFRYRPSVSVEDEVERMYLMFKEGRIKNPEDIVYHNGNYLRTNLNPRIVL